VARQSKKQLGEKSPFPKVVKPMLATLTAQPFNKPGWIYELKWDGYRVVAMIQNGKVVLRSREAQDYTSRYPAVAKALSTFKKDMVLDGEVVVLDDKGQPDFNELQRYNGSQPIVYYAFDLLWLDGYSMFSVPLLERKQLLASLIPGDGIVKYSDHFDDGVTLFGHVQSLGLEGIIAKKSDSNYLPGKRVNSWLKIKANKRQEFVIGGWAESGSNQPFKTLLFGHYENGRLHYVHHGGGGFTYRQKQDFLVELKKYEIKKSPFVNAEKVDVDTPVHWIKPVFVAEFEISTKETRNGFIRHPAIFKGLRTDKKPEQVVKENTAAVLPANDVAPAKKTRGAKQPRIALSEDSNWPEILSQKITSKETFNISGHDLVLTNVEKKLWHEVTKADLIQYYHTVAPFLLPHLQDRPLSLHIKHISPTAPGLYIKDMEGRQPEWATIFTTERKHKKKGKRDVIDYLVCQDEATLLYLVNLGCIDINPWTARTTAPLQPDYIVIDLDPSDDDFSKAIEAALASKECFNAHKLTAFVKTSGKTGIHICIPCSGFGFPEARKIAEHMCSEIHDMLPDITTTAVSINLRGNKLYLDPNQNDEADTIAAAYSVRPYHLPTVSTPLAWKEVTRKLHPHDFTIATVPDRLEKKGDLFKGVMDKKIALKNNKPLSDFL
jgi:bifunctional non-homologous end joining protein LigD